MPRPRSGTLIALVLPLLVSLVIPIAPALAIEIACPPPPTVTATVAVTPASIPATEAAFPEGDIEITVFAAASLTDAYAEIGDAIAEEHPNVTVRVETAGSQTLVTQLQEGAEADVLATADSSSMTQAQEAGLLDGDPVAFTSNSLVIVTPGDNPAGIDGIEDLAGDGIRLVIAGEDVPAGRYARAAFCAWAGDDAGALAAIGDNVVSEEVDVRSVLTKVQLGEADAGVVYASDAAAAEIAGTPVRVVEFPNDVPTGATYPFAPVAGGDTEAARAFIAFVLGDEGQAILASYGFTPVS
jgi:molybdate transport system substrate-binding protein